MKLSRAWQGYLLHAEARDLSHHTLADYRRTFERFLKFTGDLPINQICKSHVERFLQSLDGLSKKTKLNYHTGLSAFWTWLMSEELAADHLLRRIDPPRPQPPAISPLTEPEVKLLLASLERSRPYRRNFQREPSTHANPHALRNKAIIFLLLDTGLRAGELCDLLVADIDFRNREIEVRQGKGDKSRFVYFSAKTGKILWRYLNNGPGRETDPAFITAQGLALGPRGLQLMLARAGRKAGIKNVYPHRLRHTFAINYLRNGGDAFTLQKILGHSDMAMVRRYLELAREDIAARHYSASPVANWNI